MLSLKPYDSTTIDKFNLEFRFRCKHWDSISAGIPQSTYIKVNITNSVTFPCCDQYFEVHNKQSVISNDLLIM